MTPQTVTDALNAYQAAVDSLGSLQADVTAAATALTAAVAALGDATAALTAGHQQAAANLATLIGLLQAELPS